MLLLSIIRHSVDDDRSDIQNFLFDDVSSLSTFITNSYEHELETFSKSFLARYQLDVGIGFVDCSVEDFSIADITKLNSLFSTSDEDKVLEDNWLIEYQVNEVHYIDSDKALIPVKLKEVFDRVKKRTSELNYGY